jgi:hypothetical protein
MPDMKGWKRRVKMLLNRIGPPMLPNLSSTHGGCCCFCVVVCCAVVCRDAGDAAGEDGGGEDSRLAS